METPREVMTPEQVAEYLQLDRETIYRYIRSGKLAAAKLGRYYRVEKLDIDLFLQASRRRDDFAPRDYTKEEIDKWVAEDVVDDATREAFKRAVKML